MKSPWPLLALASLVLWACSGAQHAPDSAAGEAELIQTVSEGEEIDLETILEEGEWTVVQFTAPWCGACRQLEPQLLELVRERGNVRLRRIDIRSWDSPVAKQHGIESIPQLWLHDGLHRVSTHRAGVLTFLKGP